MDSTIMLCSAFFIPFMYNISHSALKGGEDSRMGTLCLQGVDNKFKTYCSNKMIIWPKLRQWLYNHNLVFSHRSSRAQTNLKRRSHGPIKPFEMTQSHAIHFNFFLCVSSAISLKKWPESIYNCISLFKVVLYGYIIFYETIYFGHAIILIQKTSE